MLELFHNRFIYKHGAPKSAPTPAVSPAKPTIDANFETKDRNDKLPSLDKLTLNTSKEALAKTTSAVVAAIDKQSTAQTNAIDAYVAAASKANKGTVDNGTRTWAREMQKKVLEAAGVAKARYREKLSSAVAKIDELKAQKITSIEEGLRGLASKAASEREKVVADNKANFDKFAQSPENKEWLEKHNPEVEVAIDRATQKMAEDYTLRRLNEWDNEVGDGGEDDEHGMSLYKEGGYFDDVVTTDRGEYGEYFEAVYDKDHLEQEVQGAATAMIAIFGKETEQKFAKECQNQASETVSVGDDGFYQKDIYDAVDNIVGVEIDRKAAIKIMKEIEDYKNDSTAVWETHGFVYASLAAAEKLLARKDADGKPDRSLIDMYTNYLKKTAAAVKKRGEKFDYRDFMNPKTFKEKYGQIVAEMARNDKSLEKPKENITDYTEKNEKFFNGIKGKLANYTTVLSNLKNSLGVDVKNPDIANVEKLIASLRKGEVEAKQSTDFVGPPAPAASPMAVVDIAASAQGKELAKMVVGIKGNVEGSARDAVNGKRQELIQKLADNPTLHTVNAMMKDPKHPGHAKMQGPSQAATRRTYAEVAQMIKTFGKVNTTKIDADNPSTVVTVMDELKTADKLMNERLSDLAWLVEPVKPKFKTAMKFKTGPRGFDFEARKAFLDVVNKGTKWKDRGEVYYKSLAAFERSEGVKVLADGKALDTKGKNIFTLLKSLPKGTSVQIDTTGLEKAIAGDKRDSKDVRREMIAQYRKTAPKRRASTASRAIAKVKAEPARVASTTKGTPATAPAAPAKAKTPGVSRRGAEKMAKAGERHIVQPAAQIDTKGQVRRYG